MSINWLRVVFPSIIKLPPPLPLRYSSPSSCSCFSSVVVAMSYDKELTAAKKAASLAARLCQKVQKSLLQSDVQSKNDRSPVTVADYGSQALVSFVLQQEFPAEFSLVAEEDSKDLRKDGAQELVDRITKLVNDSLASDESYSVTLSTEDVLKAIDSGKSEGGSQGRHWVLDPIDGTKGFLRGGQYAIALALLDRGKVVLGVLACPNLPLTPINDQHSPNNEVGCLFFAEVGGGSYMQPLDSSSTVKVQVSGVENPEEASFFESYEAAHSMHDLSSLIAQVLLSLSLSIYIYIYVCMYFHACNVTLRCKQKLGVKAPPVRIDSQVKYGALSRGDGAIYMRLPHKGYREKIWDHAAGCIVVTEAGGVVMDAAGNPLDFSKGKFLDLDTGIIVTNQKLMPILIKAVRESLEEKASPL
ncbi:PREDICTED: SAL1 phosphatase isoform X1 [Theobroma cacao]|uniref:SAL1 phosphatase isoform X1 n=1 Tax=Theobroma cacao TaxID=3641 RepID=A0AB32WU66_THECC|nr:PREDICTED: SAL1 phosphatase isoform X1 [Theobroma cacao]